MKKSNKLVAWIYLNERIKGMIPEYHDIRYIANEDLTEQQCESIVRMIIEMGDRIREPLLRKIEKESTK